MKSIEDSTSWEAGFRTHGPLLANMSQNVTYFTTTAENKVALYSEPEDLNTFMEVLESEATAEAMIADGVKRDTVQVYVLDREFVY